MTSSPISPDHALALASRWAPRVANALFSSRFAGLAEAGVLLACDVLISRLSGAGRALDRPARPALTLGRLFALLRPCARDATASWASWTSSPVSSPLPVSQVMALPLSRPPNFARFSPPSVVPPPAPRVRGVAFVWGGAITLLPSSGRSPSGPVKLKNYTRPERCRSEIMVPLHLQDGMRTFRHKTGSVQ